LLLSFSLYFEYECLFVVRSLRFCESLPHRDSSQSKTTTVATAVLWRPSKCFDASTLILEAFAPVAGLFGVVFVGCLLAGAVVVVIELKSPSSAFFRQESGGKRIAELRGGSPFGHGFWFALISTCFEALISKIFCLRFCVFMFCVIFSVCIMKLGNTRLVKI
jgi:hypothetical protein